MQQQQHIQAIMKNGVIVLKAKISLFLEICTLRASV
jgi:hypothetical protein